MRAVPVRSSFALCALLAMLSVLPSAAPAATQGEIDSAVAKALAFAPTQQDPATGEPPGYEHTGFYSGEWLASGYAAAGLNAADVGAGSGASLQDFLFGEAVGYWDDPFPVIPEYAARLILTAHAAGIDTARISAGLNLPAELVVGWDPPSGGFSEPNTFSTAWGALALRTTPLPAWALQPALAYLRADQHADGGWSFYPLEVGEESDPDTTAAAIGAFCTTGIPAYDPAVRRGLAYLRGLQVEATGAIAGPALGDNIDSSSWTVNALESCGIDPQSSAWTTATGKTPIDHILSLQLEDGGFPWLAGEPWFPPSLGHALRALRGDGFIADPPARANPALPRLRPVPSVAAGTPVQHLLAVELAPGNVRLCDVTAPAGASLTELLDAAKTTSAPAGCVTSFAVSSGEVTAIDGVSPPSDEAWLVRLDRGSASVAAAQPIAFGDLVSLRIGPRPPASVASSSSAPPAGQPGPVGRRGKRGARGKAGRNASILCKVRQHRRGEPRVRCAVKHKGASRRRMEE